MSTKADKEDPVKTTVKAGRSSGTAGAVPQGTTPGFKAERAFKPIDVKLAAIKATAARASKRSR